MMLRRLRSLGDHHQMFEKSRDNETILRDPTKV
jgi:hypothetical protein